MQKIILTDNKKRHLIKKQRLLIRQLSHVGPFITGSVSRLYRICGTKNCRCSTGGKKHEALYLTWKEDQNTKSLYIPVSMHAETTQWVRNYKKLKKMIKKISAVQKDILILR